MRLIHCVFASTSLLLGQGLAAQCDGGGGAPPVPSFDSGPSTPSPATPSTPSPATPSTPGPNTPSTPTPGGRRAAPSTPRGGIAINFTRQSTSRALLEVEWDFVVPKQIWKARESKTTSAAPVLRAEPAGEAFGQIAGDDPRPLLILRECNKCKGTDHAFLSRRFKTEKTRLLARWFHCVKLPPSVLHHTHPFRNVFAKDNPNHMFIAMADGSEKTGFDGAAIQSKLQKEMVRLIRKSYKKNPQKALTAMLRYLSAFDNYDTMEQDLNRRLRKERYAKGPKHPKVLAIKNKIETVRKKRAQAMKAAKAVCDLKIKVVAADKKTAKKVAGSE